MGADGETVMQLDMFPAKKARDHALKQVSENAGTWMDEALAIVSSMRGSWLNEGTDFTGEGLRWYLTRARHLPEPHHPNAWGALIRTAIQRGLLIPTGRFTHMTGPKSHARMTQIYRVA